MNNNERLDRLEKQVEELTELVRALAANGGSPAPTWRQKRAARKALKRQDKAPQDDKAAPLAPGKQKIAQNVYRQDAKRNVGKVLGGEEGDTLESRIGGIWLSRIAVVLFMTMFALGARLTVDTEALLPWQKVLGAYGVALCAMLYGIRGLKSSNLFPKTILGAGVATFYSVTYAAFFVEGMRVFEERLLAIPFLLGCLAIVFAISHWSRSQTVAGIAMFLAYYTVVASCMSGGTADVENTFYALVTCTALAATALIFHVVHHWTLFSWGALIATHLTYAFYFLAKPAGLDMPDREFFWISNAFLGGCYLLFSVACIIDARKTGEYRRVVAPMSGVNSFVFFCLAWLAIRGNYVEHEWLFRLGFAGVLLFLTLLCELSGPHFNYLFQVFIAKTVIMFTLALQAYFSGEKLIVALAVECLAMTFSYKRSGVIIFKILGMFLLVGTFLGCLLHIRTPGMTELGVFAVPSNWFCCAGSAIILVVVSWFYEKFISRTPPEKRVVAGQWLLADTFLDVSSATASILHAACAAIILLTITIIDQGRTPSLPYVLAAESVLMAAGGYLLFTPQVEVASVLLLGASHLCFYVFLLGGLPGFLDQTNFATYTSLVALYTYFGAYLWERYLYRLKGGHPWEHHVIAAIPYLGATFMLTTLFTYQFEGVHVPAAQNALGVALLLVGTLTGYPGVKASGVMAFSLGTALFYRGLCDFANPYPRTPEFLLFAVLLLCTYWAGERLFVILERQERTPSRVEDMLRTILVAVGGAVGLLALSAYAEPQYRTLYWLGHAVVGFFLGALFRESRYRWLAITLFLCAMVRAFQYDLRQLSLVYQFLSFAALTMALLPISWAYARYRQRVLERASREAEQEGEEQEAEEHEAEAYEAEAQDAKAHEAEAQDAEAHNAPEHG